MRQNEKFVYLVDVDLNQALTDFAETSSYLAGKSVVGAKGISKKTKEEITEIQKDVKLMGDVLETYKLLEKHQVSVQNLLPYVCTNITQAVVAANDLIEMLGLASLETIHYKQVYRRFASGERTFAISIKKPGMIKYRFTITKRHLLSNYKVFIEKFRGGDK